MLALKSAALTRDEMFERIYAVVRSVPAGSVVTYGQVAARIGFPRHSRMVGRALRSLPEGAQVPWHRVVNSSGRVSNRTEGESHLLQRLLLEDEGVAISDNGRLDLDRFRWDDPSDSPERFAPSNRRRKT